MASTNLDIAQVRRASGLNALAAIWLFASAFVIHATGPANGPMMESNIVCGIVIATLAGFRMIGAYEEGWLSWLNVLFGLWVVVSPWALTNLVAEVPTRELAINNCIVGGAIVILAGWSGLISGLGTAGDDSSRAWPASRA